MADVMDGSASCKGWPEDAAVCSLQRKAGGLAISLWEEMLRDGTLRVQNEQGAARNCWMFATLTPLPQKCPDPDPVGWLERRLPILRSGSTISISQQLIDEPTGACRTDSSPTQAVNGIPPATDLALRTAAATSLPKWQVMSRKARCYALVTKSNPAGTFMGRET
jgi:hypothetical protein